MDREIAADPWLGVAQPRQDREQPIEGRLSVRHSHGCRWDREQNFARRYGDCDAIECSTLARTSGQVDRREIRRKFVRLSGGGRRIQTSGSWSRDRQTVIGGPYSRLENGGGTVEEPKDAMGRAARMATSSLHFIDGVPRCPSRMT